MNKVDKLKNSKRCASLNYQDIDRSVELIYRMNNQELKNLHKLDNYKILLDKSGSVNSGLKPAFQRSYSEAYKSESKDFQGNKGREFYKENFGTMNLNRKVIIKQYAPKTFKRIRQNAGIKDE